MKITVRMLKQKGACQEQVALFGRLWPKGCQPSLRMAQRASRAGLDLNYFAFRFLSSRAWYCWVRARQQIDNQVWLRGLPSTVLARALWEAWLIDHPVRRRKIKCTI